MKTDWDVDCFVQMLDITDDQEQLTVNTSVILEPVLLINCTV